MLTSLLLPSTPIIHHKDLEIAVTMDTDHRRPVGGGGAQEWVPQQSYVEMSVRDERPGHEGETRTLITMPNRMTQVKLNGKLGHIGSNGMRSGLCWKDTGELGDASIPSGHTTFTPWSTLVGEAGSVVVETGTLVRAQHPIYDEIDRLKQDSDYSGFSLAWEDEVQLRTYGSPRMQTHEAKFSFDKMVAKVETLRASGEHVLFPPTGYTPSTQRGCVEESKFQGRIWSMRSMQAVEQALVTGVAVLFSNKSETEEAHLDGVFCDALGRRCITIRLDAITEQAAELARQEARKTCSCCGKGSEKALMACGACKLPRYCSQECQMKHWKAGHKKECKALCKKAKKGAKK